MDIGQDFNYRPQKIGNVYNGEWKDGMRHGYGFEKWPDGAEYEGHY